MSGTKTSSNCLGKWLCGARAGEFASGARPSALLDPHSAPGTQIAKPEGMSGFSKL